MKKDMKALVRAGYDSGNYTREFRTSTSLSGFEAIMFTRLVEKLREGDSVIDLGCGAGVPYDSYLAGKGYGVLGIDFSSKHIAQARENVPGASFVLADYTAINLPDSAFGGLLALYTLFHVPRAEHEQILRKMHGSLKNGGVALITLGTSGFEYSEENNWAGSPVMAWSSWPPETYYEMLSGAGFSILRKKYEGNPGDREYHLWVLAQKQR